jgi:hypothetical protein
MGIPTRTHAVKCAGEDSAPTIPLPTTGGNGMVGGGSYILGMRNNERLPAKKKRPMHRIGLFLGIRNDQIIF